MHSGGNTTFLRFLNESSFQWTSSESAGRSSAWKYYNNAEGISYFDGVLYFTVKTTKSLFVLDLEGMTYTQEFTGEALEGEKRFCILVPLHFLFYKLQIIFQSRLQSSKKDHSHLSLIRLSRQIRRSLFTSQKKVVGAQVSMSATRKAHISPYFKVFRKDDIRMMRQLALR